MKLIQHNLFLVVLPSFEFPVNPPCAERDAKANGIDGLAAQQSEPSDRVTLLFFQPDRHSCFISTLSRFNSAGKTLETGAVQLWCVNSNTL